MSTVSSRAAASLSTASAGSPASQTSSCRYVRCRGLFRRLFLNAWKPPSIAANSASSAIWPGLLIRRVFAERVRALRQGLFVVYAKPPFGGPERVLAYLARYTHRTAIANSRLVAVADDEVAFTYKDYRRGGRNRVLRLEPHEFIRRFLLHALPDGFHRIRHSASWLRATEARSSNACASSSPRDRADIQAKSLLRQPRQTRMSLRPVMLPNPTFSPSARSAAASCAVSAPSRPSASSRFPATHHDDDRALQPPLQSLPFSAAPFRSRR